MPHDVITPDLLLRAYASGIFPMSDDRHDDELFWVEPEERGVLPLNNFHIPKSLKKVIKKEPFEIKIDSCFRRVVQNCAAPARGRENTWISERIEHLYSDLFERGYAHSVECYKDDQLVGGLYGVSLGGAFFGESMFSRETNASKVALVYLVARLKVGGFQLLDTQFITSHLQLFGAEAIPSAEYKLRLKEALLTSETDFYKLSESTSVSGILQLITQTS